MLSANWSLLFYRREIQVSSSYRSCFGQDLFYCDLTSINTAVVKHLPSFQTQIVMERNTIAHACTPVICSQFLGSKSENYCLTTQKKQTIAVWKVSAPQSFKLQISSPFNNKLINYKSTLKIAALFILYSGGLEECIIMCTLTACCT